MTGPAEQGSAGEWLESLAGVGWRPGLGRSVALMDALDSPQDRYRTIHVVGTNGKTSTTLYSESLLEASGERAGSLTSPHLDAWTERVRVAGIPIGAGPWEEALARTRRAVREVESSLPDAGPVTQFEAATAAGFLALADAGIGFAVIEAGLGGRLDSTNVIRSEVTVLTSVGLDHTEWLGETELEIAAEKLAVLRPGSALVTGPLSPEVRDLAARVSIERGAGFVEVDDPGEGSVVPTGRYARIDFALAVTAVEMVAGPLDGASKHRALERVGLRGRLELIREDPPVVLDVAHNRDAIEALADSLTQLTGGGPLVLLFGCLDDRDPLDLLEPLASGTVKVIACRTPSRSGPAGRSGLDPGSVATAAGKLGLEAEACEEPAEALELAVREARRLDATVLVCGSHGLIGEITRLQS